MDHDGPNRLDNWGRIISLRIIFGPLLRLFVPDRENPLVTVLEQAHVAIAVDVANDCADIGGVPFSPSQVSAAAWGGWPLRTS
jgi:hypothetical protein